MLSFKKTNMSEISCILSDACSGDISHMKAVLSGKRDVSFATVDGCIIFMTSERGAEFTFPIGDAWQAVIALLVTYTREYYLPLNFIGVRRDDVNKLLSMFPNYAPVIRKSDSVPCSYDVSL